MSKLKSNLIKLSIHASTPWVPDEDPPSFWTSPFGIMFYFFVIVMAVYTAFRVYTA